MARKILISLGVVVVVVYLLMTAFVAVDVTEIIADRPQRIT